MYDFLFTSRCPSTLLVAPLAIRPEDNSWTDAVSKSHPTSGVFGTVQVRAVIDNVDRDTEGLLGQVLLGAKAMAVQALAALVRRLTGGTA